MMGAHWTDVARVLAIELRGLDRVRRVARIAERAAELGVTPHTVRRYGALLRFLEQLGVDPQEGRRMPTSVLEAILRIRSRDAAAAAAAIQALRSGELTLRSAAAIEKSVRTTSAQAAVQPRTLDGYATRLPWEQIAEALHLPASVLAEFPIEDDPRSVISRPDRTLACGTQTLAFFDEGKASDGKDFGPVVLARQALVAAALFDHVVVRLSYTYSQPSFESLVGFARPEATANIKVIWQGEPGSSRTSGDERRGNPRAYRAS